jgi:oligopeptide transport system permease protein
VQEPQTSWGTVVNDGARELEGAPWLLLFPTGFLAVTLLCLNFLGDALRDALDPRHQDRAAGEPLSEPATTEAAAPAAATTP